MHRLSADVTEAYRGRVLRDDPPEEMPGADERRRLAEELIGLDQNDPEVRAFSEHLDRTHRQRPGFTVEGYLSGVTDFADSANRAEGLRRAVAVLMVVLMLFGAAFAIWEATVFIVATLLA